MRRQDVQIGVEYAETAPLAYGREPNVRPVKVRFTDNRPGPWVRIITQRKDEGASALGGPGWTTIDVVVKREKDLTDEELGLPRSMRDAMERGWGKTEGVTRKRVGGTPYRTTQTALDVRDIPIGAIIVHIDGFTKGLPGERWTVDHETHQRCWRPTVIETAAVHRTWAEVEESQHAANERSAALDAEAKIAEIQALLYAAGLNLIFTDVDRYGSGSTRTGISSGGLRSGQELLVALTEWADTMLDPKWRLRYNDALVTGVLS